jgi:hypothetical protein
VCATYDPAYHAGQSAITANQFGARDVALEPLQVMAVR